MPALGRAATLDEMFAPEVLGAARQRRFATLSTTSALVLSALLQVPAFAQPTFTRNHVDLAYGGGDGPGKSYDPLYECIQDCSLCTGS